MSYEGRLRTLKAVAAGFLSSYGITVSLVLAVALGALYLAAGRTTSRSDFPRDSAQFMGAKKAERRLSELSGKLADNPSDIDALFEAGRLKFGLGQTRYIEAIADLEKARALGLADVRAFYYLGRMYQAEGLYEFALQEYERFLNNEPGDAEVRMLYAKLSYAAGDYPVAVREFEKLLPSSPGDPVLLENLALSRWKNGQDYSAAVASLRALGGAGAFLADQAEGTIAYEKKDHKNAAPLLRKAAAAAPPDFEGRAALLWHAADSSHKNKELEAARDTLQELLKLEPAHEEAKALLTKAEKALRAEEKKKSKKK